MAAPVGVGDFAVTGPAVVTVRVVGGIVVPGTVVAASVITVGTGAAEPTTTGVVGVTVSVVVASVIIVATGVAVLELTTTVGVIVTTPAAIVVGGIVVPGMVVVYVISAPRALAGIALPTPEAVYCVGRVNVAVFGFAAGSEP